MTNNFYNNSKYRTIPIDDSDLIIIDKKELRKYRKHNLIPTKYKGHTRRSNKRSLASRYGLTSLF